MSVIMQITVRCDGCGERHQNNGTNTAALRKWLKEERGWVWVQEDEELKDYCPKCQAKREGTSA